MKTLCLVLAVVSGAAVALGFFDKVTSPADWHHAKSVIFLAGSVMSLVFFALALREE